MALPASQNTIVIGIVAVILIGFILFNPSESQIAQEKETGIKKGDIAPNFELADVQGNTVKLSDFRGKKVILNFWATWCPFCVDEMPLFEEKFKERDDLVILGVNLQENKDTAVNFGKELNITYPLLLDPNSSVKRLYNVFTQPVTYFIDEKGKIIDTKFGPLTEEEFETKLNSFS